MHLVITTLGKTGKLFLEIFLAIFFQLRQSRGVKQIYLSDDVRQESPVPTTILEVRAAKIADEIFAICADTTPGELSQHQLVTAVILRELKKQRGVVQPSTVCARCGKSEDEHHAFVPVMRPAGCKCNVKDWRRNHAIPPVCSKYEKGDCGYYCKNCEHDPECHAG